MVLNFWNSYFQSWSIHVYLLSNLLLLMTTSYTTCFILCLNLTEFLSCISIRVSNTQSDMLCLHMVFFSTHFKTSVYHFYINIAQHISVLLVCCCAKHLYLLSVNENTINAIKSNQFLSTIYILISGNLASRQVFWKGYRFPKKTRSKLLSPFT